MKTIFAFAVVFFSGAVFSINLSALEPAWWKGGLSLAIAALFTAWELTRGKR